jgi:sugar phosphate isomerase/epimerase
MNIPRRQFLKTGALVGGALALPSLAAEKFRAEEPQTVELCIATICCDGMGDENFKYAFDAIPQLGLKNVEFNLWFPRNHTPAAIRSIQERCTARGLRPVCLQSLAFGGGTKDALVKDITHKLWLMDACRELGCRRIKCTGYKRDTEGGLDAVIRILKELEPAAREKNVLLLVENHAGSTLETIADYDRVFSAVDSTHVALCLDPAHFAAASVKPEDVIARFPKKVWHFDLKDLARWGAKGWARYGQGVLDLEGMAKSLLASGYRGYFCLELSLQDRATMMADVKKGVAMFGGLAR